MRVSDYYNLERSQGTLDFVDVDTVMDIPVYIDPGAIKSLSDDWGTECVKLLTTFFDSVLDAVRTQDQRRVRELLVNLREPNETHLGISAGESKGRGFGRKAAEEFAAKLMESEAAKSGLIEDLEDTAFFIDRVGRDIVSDITTNIIRGPLISYTRQMAGFFGIPLTEGVDSGPVWNPVSLEWERGLTDLPTPNDEKLILVPKVIVRLDLHLSRGDYYKDFLIPTLQGEEESNPKSSLVTVLKNGQRRAYRKDLQEKYGNSKGDVRRETLARESVYRKFKEEKSRFGPAPISHKDLVRVSGSPSLDYTQLLQAVTDTPTGHAYAEQYHSSVEALLGALLYPSLSMPEKEHEIHGGRKRIDISYANTAKDGFFSFLTHHKIPAKYVFVECKNYGSEVGNPELDQISSRFSPLRGKFGILTCRSFRDKDLFLRRCRDTALDHRGFVVALDDNDIRRLVKDVIEAVNWSPPDPLPDEPIRPPQVHDFPILHERLKELMS